MAAIEVPNITVRRGVPLPPRRQRHKPDARKVSQVLAGLKKGESFLISPQHRARVLIAANYLRRKGAIPYRIMSRSVIEGGVKAVCIWRVEE